MHHSAATNHVMNRSLYTFDPSTMIHACQSGVASDLAITELFSALFWGGQLIVIDRKILLDFKQLEKVYRKYKVNIIIFMTPLFHVIAEQRPSVFETVKQMTVLGDSLNLKLAAKVDGAKIFNYSCDGAKREASISYVEVRRLVSL